MRNKTIVFVTVLGILLVAGVLVAQSTDGSPEYVDLYASIDRSPEGLIDYQAHMLTLHDVAVKEGVDELFSTITLSHPQPIEKVEAMIQNHGIIPRTYTAYARGQDDDVVTISVRQNGRVDANEMIPMMAADDNAELLGVVALVGVVPTGHIFELQSNPDVFLVDVTADRHFVKNPRHRGHAHHFAWDLLHQRK